MQLVTFLCVFIFMHSSTARSFSVQKETPTFHFNQSTSSHLISTIAMEEKTVVIKASAPLPEAVPYYGEPAPGGYPLQVQVVQPVGMAQPSVGYERSETFDDSNQQIRIGEWETRLCGCFTHLVPNCLMATFFPCVSLAQIAARLGVAAYGPTLLVFLVVVGVQYVMNGLISYEVYTHENSTDYVDSTYDHYWWHYSTDEDYGVAYHVYSAVACAAEVVIFVFVWHLRGKTRDRFELPGNCCGDFWISLCCSCCAIAQMATHVKSYKPGSCSFGPPDTLPAYPRDTTPTAVPSNYV